ncbi:MAG TPA: hypothetical protein VM580_03075 [Labilithrix sp.]|nr:hypothetical protein [Labilithrix sp.]
MAVSLDPRSKLAPHEVILEPETNFVHLVGNGEVTTEQMATLIVILAAQRAKQPEEPLYVLANIKNTTRIARDARLAVANRAKTRPGPMYMGVFGGSLTTRVVLGLMIKAVNLATTRHQLTANMLAEEAEARVWLAEQQRRHSARTT